jgi:uncharacterized membrane protein (DUF373 family)
MAQYTKEQRDGTESVVGAYVITCVRYIMVVKYGTISSIHSFTHSFIHSVVCLATSP